MDTVKALGKGIVSVMKLALKAGVGVLLIASAVTEYNSDSNPIRIF